MTDTQAKRRAAEHVEWVMKKLQAHAEMAACRNAVQAAQVLPTCEQCQALADRLGAALVELRAGVEPEGVAFAGARGSANLGREEAEDTRRMDFLDSVGQPWPEEKKGIRLLLVALPYKMVEGQIPPRTIREAIDYILDCPESLLRAKEAAGSGEDSQND